MKETITFPEGALLINSKKSPGGTSTGRNGSTWQVLASHRTSATRGDALRTMLCEYRERMHSNVPVHEWPLL